MQSNASSTDTIAARATPPGIGSIAVLRMSGGAALSVAERLFVPRGGGGGSAAGARSAGSAGSGGSGGDGGGSGVGVRALPDRTATLGLLHRRPGGDPLDECVLLLWRGPHSYTGEDVVEFHLHGGPRLVESALEALYACGVRAAQPGEFTRRAFLNGRLDLAQAEAVADLIVARTDQAARCALGQLTGGLSLRIAALRADLVTLAAECEAYIDFPEEGLPESDRARQGAGMEEVLRRLEVLLRDARRGRPLREGARIAIAGCPNAGKSSLLNALVGRERAIVAPHPGTTRDTIEAQVDLRGIPAVLIDTAGLREQSESVEALGIARTHDEIAAADLVVFVLDASEPIRGQTLDAFARVRSRPHLVALNKTDLPVAFSRAEVEKAVANPLLRGMYAISARTRSGLEELEAAMQGVLEGSPGGAMEDNPESPLVANARHIALLEASRSHLRRAFEGHTARLPLELVAVDLREALLALGAITGHTNPTEDILDSIFSTFCIGK